MKKVILLMMIVGMIVFAGCESEEVKSVDALLVEKHEKVDEITSLDEYKTEYVKEVYKVNIDKDQEHIVQVVESNGYKSVLTLMVEIDKKTDQIYSVDILKENETDRKIKRIKEQGFLEKFKGRNTKDDIELVKKKEKESNDVSIVSKATITSGAIARGVQMSIENYNNIK